MEENIQQTAAEQEETQTQETIKTFSQEEVNKIVNERLARERKKYASMFQEDGKTSELDERERNLTIRERKLDCMELFKEKGLPCALIDLVNYNSKEEYENSVNVIEAAFRESVETSVNSRLRGSGVPRMTNPIKGNDVIGNAFKPV